MSHKKALLASSLTVCSASTSFAVSSHEGSVAYAEDYLQQLPSHPSPKMELNESTQQYLKPVTMDLVDQSIQKSSKSITYKVKKGDTLYQIGLFFGIHYQDLAEFNHIVDPRKLQVGQELVIPLQIEEIPIDKPMTVPQLAKAYHTTVELMVYLNPIFQEQTVTEKGQWIAVPKR